MILKMYSIRDSKAEIYNRIWCLTTHGEAERAFRDLANDDGTTVGKHPEDYDLYYLGKFDDNSGKFEPVDSPEHIVKAVNLVKQLKLDQNVVGAQEVLPL